MLHDICVGKTGTLTKGKMRVDRYQLTNNLDVQISEGDSFMRECPNPLKELIRESIIANTDVRIEINEKDCTYEPKGQPIEEGMIQFLIENEEDINERLIERNKYSPKIIQLPFSQAHKRKVVVRQVPGN
jgi:magnesium-transporting ATPase (P-type)